MQKRLQSPSSINTYKQCPRKYYYKYILKLPTVPSFHMVRGKMAHSVLEDFFDIDISEINMKNFEIKLKQQIQKLFFAHWKLNGELIKNFDINPDKEKFYFSETMLMLLNWLEQFIQKVKNFENLSFAEIFKKLTPLREKRFLSEDLYVQGFIDAIEHTDNEILIMDYKTSTNLNINEEQRLQLAIYSLLYKEKHGQTPNKAGIYFLRYKPKFIAVDEELLAGAKHEIKLIHQNTQSTNIDDYPLKPGPLCKWSSGQCDFYSICFEQKTIKAFESEAKEAPLKLNQ